MLCWIWDQQPWCCHKNPSDDLVGRVLLPSNTRCTDYIIFSHTDLQLNLAVGSLVHHPCWCGLWRFLFLPYVDHGVVDVPHLLLLVGWPALVGVLQVRRTLLMIRSLIVLHSWWGQRGCVPFRQGWWEAWLRCHTLVGLVDWFSHNLARQVLEAGFSWEFLRRCRQQMSASPLCWRCVVK